jgi:hypothetical protein
MELFMVKGGNQTRERAEGSDGGGNSVFFCSN